MATDEYVLTRLLASKLVARSSPMGLDEVRLCPIFENPDLLNG